MHGSVHVEQDTICSGTTPNSLVDMRPFASTKWPTRLNVYKSAQKPTRCLQCFSDETSDRVPGESGYCHRCVPCMWCHKKTAEMTYCGVDTNTAICVGCQRCRMCLQDRSEMSPYGIDANTKICYGCAHPTVYDTPTRSTTYSCDKDNRERRVWNTIRAARHIEHWTHKLVSKGVLTAPLRLAKCTYGMPTSGPCLMGYEMRLMDIEATLLALEVQAGVGHVGIPEFCLGDIRRYAVKVVIFPRPRPHDHIPLRILSGPWKSSKLRLPSNASHGTVGFSRCVFWLNKLLRPSGQRFFKKLLQHCFEHDQLRELIRSSQQRPRIRAKLGSGVLSHDWLDRALSRQ